MRNDHPYRDPEYSWDEKIPASELAIKSGDSKLTKEREVFAKNAKQWKKG